MELKQYELNGIVESHQHWLKRDCDGWYRMRANLSNDNIRWKYLKGVDLRGGVFRKVDATSADFSHADLRNADFTNAILCGANFVGANLERAIFDSANLCGAKFSLQEQKRFGRILTEPLIGYKKTREGVVITAEIPAGAIVFCINGKKCRTNRAKIIDMEGWNFLYSQHDMDFQYYIGKEIVIKDFNMMYNVECASGFHFFEDRKDAEDY